MSLRSVVTSKRAIVLALVFMMTFAIANLTVAQETPAPKVEVFGGYSWYHPGGNVGTIKPPDITKGFGAAATWFPKRWVGLTADFSGHFNSQLNAYTFLFGPTLKARTGQVSPFIEALGGFVKLDPKGFPSKNSPSFAGGGGLDIDAGRWVAIRLIQADYIYTTYSQKGIPGTQRWDGARVQGGLVLKLGVPPAEGPVSAACAVAPTAVMAGEPVKVTLTPTGFLPKRTLSYSWASTGGKAAGTEATTTVDTTGLAPGQYTVTGTATDNGKGKHQQSAKCSAGFTVNEPPKHPPTATCSANPTSVRAGDPSTISVQANSPDNRPLSYQWSSTAGRISGTGPSATLDTAGAPAGPITVTTTVADDRNLSTTCNSQVNVEVPPPPPTASQIGSINFPDKKRPARVDNAAKATLDDVALRLQREPDAKAVVVGHGTDTKTVKKLAAQRAVNTKAYLVDEKGIDPSRIEVRDGGGDQATADIWIVPTGATFSGEGTTVVDESKVKPAKKPAAPARKKKAPAAQ